MNLQKCPLVALCKPADGSEHGFLQTNRLQLVKYYCKWVTLIVAEGVKPDLPDSFMSHAHF